ATVTGVQTCALPIFPPDRRANWNAACDAEINDDLIALKLRLPGQPVLPSTLGQPEDRLAEEYYANLDEADDARVPGDDCGSGAGGPQRSWESAAGEDMVSDAEALLVCRRVAADVAAAVAAGAHVPDAISRW